MGRSPCGVSVSPGSWGGRHTEGDSRWPRLSSGLFLGFHLNNQLTQALTSRYRDSCLRVDFERCVSCVAQLTCIFRECHPGTGAMWGGCLPRQGGWGGGAHPPLSAQATAAGTWMGARGSYA